MPRFAFALSLVLVSAVLVCAGDWPQFRGPNATGVSLDDARLPDEIGPDTNVVWKVETPVGHSSPVVVGDRIYLTGVRGKKLVTLALDRKTGKTLWEQEAPAKGLEKVHQVGNAAQPSPAADGDGVVTFFGSCGLQAYDTDGKQLWHLPMGPFKNDFGAGSSPILVGDTVILNQDHDLDSVLMAVDKKTGKPIWQTQRTEFTRGYSTPVIWDVGGKKQVVVVGTLRVVGYDFATGKEVWTVRGLSRIVNMTPVVGSDGILYVAAWAPGTDPAERITLTPQAEYFAKQDKNKNGTLEDDEVPPGPVKERFTQFDRDKDGHITKAEYENFEKLFLEGQNVMVAIKPGGKGDITKTHVLWEQTKQLPYVPSPLYHKDHIYLVKNNGIFSSFDAKTGKAIKQERVYGTGNYYASPVCGDGKIYTISQRGDVSVVSALPEWKLLSQAKMGEDVFATPAISNGNIFLRTAGHLYCFGKK